MKWFVLIMVLVLVLLLNAMTWGATFYMLYTYGSPKGDGFVIGSTFFSILSGFAALIFSYLFAGDID